VVNNVLVSQSLKIHFAAFLMILFSECDESTEDQSNRDSCFVDDSALLYVLPREHHTFVFLRE
jgi:hypothetical protein